MIRKLLLSLVVLTCGAFGQAVRYDSIAQVLTANNLYTPVSNGTVLVYNYPGATTNCAIGTCTLATTYIDDIGVTSCGTSVPLTRPTFNGCIGSTDAGANFGFWIKPGSYQYCISGTGVGTNCTNITVASPAPNILYTGSLRYACTSPGIANLLSDATGQANAEGCLSGFTSTSEIDIGSAIKSGISLIHPSTSAWTFNFNNSAACGVKIFDGTTFSGYGSAASSDGAFTLTAPGTAVMDSLLCTNLTGVNYTSAENIRLYSPNGATFTHGALNIENNVDGSWFRNIVVANYSGISIFWWNNCCAAYGEGLLANGNYGANAVPMLISSDAIHNVIASNFFSTSLGHAGAGKNNLAMSNGGNNHWCGGNNFFGLYTEGTGDTTTPSVDVACGATSIFGMRLDNDAASTRYAVQIEAGTDGVNVFGLSSTTSTNLINDIVNGIQVTEPAQIPVNYSSMNTWFPFLHIGGPSGGPGGIYNRNLLFSASQPTLGSGFGTSPSIPTNNGDTAFSINVGTGGTATTGTINFNATATNRWIVHCQDRTTFSTTVFTTRQTASTTTSATVGNFNTSAVAAAWAASDILDCLAVAE